MSAPRTPSWNVVVTLRGGFARMRSLLGRWGWVDRTGLYNVLAVEADDPRAFLDELHEAVRADPELLELIGHVAPASETFCFTSAEDFATQARAVAERWAERLAGRSFHVRMHRRGFKGQISGLQVEQVLDKALLEAAQARGTPARISFEDPDVVISIETIRGWAGMGLWTREDLERYPLLAKAFHLDTAAA
ncbi:MAG: THUMP domain-containing protein [Enhygromyxa sp.]